MTPSALSQVFSWAAIVCSVLAAASTGLALHYRTLAGRQQAAEIAELKAYSQQRQLTNEQEVAILTALSPYEGQTVTVVSIIGDEDGQTYAKQFFDVLTRAKWSVEYGHPLQWNFSGKTPVGLGVWVNGPKAQSGKILMAADVLSNKRPQPS